MVITPILLRDAEERIRDDVLKPATGEKIRVFGDSDFIPRRTRDRSPAKKWKADKPEGICRGKKRRGNIPLLMEDARLAPGGGNLASVKIP